MKKQALFAVFTTFIENS